MHPAPVSASIAAVALGSNLNSAEGDRTANLRRAVERIRGLGNVLAVSSFYDTAPVGYLDQPRFLNAALLLKTDLPPSELLDRLLGIEKQMGRDRSATVSKGPRIIDLDLLLFDSTIVEFTIMRTPALTLPHPALRDRRFVLEPLAEIAPDMVDPVTGLTVRQLLHRLAPEPRGADSA